MEDVVDEIGEENVVQIVTDNATNYKAAGDLLMQKRKNLYWTTCEAHCIDLMLEDFKKKLPLHKDTIAASKKITTYIYSRAGIITLLHHFTKGGDLIRPGAARFVTSYLTLGCLNDKRRELIRMVTSQQWKSSTFAKSIDGVFVENQILDTKGFWNNVVNCLRGAYPLIRVLRLVDSDEKPAMGFIYEEMDHAKERIRSAFKEVSRSYTPLWEIIDQRWDRQLHRPLHAASYYLNPILYYGPNFKADYEVKKGLYDCLERLVGDRDQISIIDGQFEHFKGKMGFFSTAVAMCALPAQWWESYADEYPELQRFAIRVLSLTCNASGCERNWSAFERVHTKKRNRLMQKTMNDVVFVMVNSKINNKKKARKAKDHSIDELSSDDEWLVENDEKSDLDASIEDDFDHVEEDASGGGIQEPALGDDLEIPNAIDDDECEEDAIDENEDHMEDDFTEIGLNAILDI